MRNNIAWWSRWFPFHPNYAIYTLHLNISFLRKTGGNAQKLLREYRVSCNFADGARRLATGTALPGARPSSSLPSLPSILSIDIGNAATCRRRLCRGQWQLPATATQSPAAHRRGRGWPRRPVPPLEARIQSTGRQPRSTPSNAWPTPSGIGKRDGVAQVQAGRHN